MVISNDDVEGKSSITSSGISLGDFIFFISISPKDLSTLTLVFKVNKGGCVNDYDDVYFLFRNEKRLKFNNEKFNCDGWFWFNLVDKLDKGEFTTNLIKAISLNTDKRKLKIELTEDQSLLLQSIFLCANDKTKWQDQVKYK